MERAVISAISNGSSTQDFTHSGSWQPKVAIFQWSRANTSINTFQEHASVGYGFTDGTNQRAIATASEDNAARGDSARIQRDNCLIVTLNPSGTIETVDSVATFNSWLSNGIRINWTDQPAANFYITVTLLGGSEITDVLVGTFMTTTGSGDVSYTSASFEANYGMFLSGGTGTLNSPVVGGSMMLGMATGTSGNVSQWVQSLHSVDNPVTMSTRQYYSDSKVFEIHTTATDGYATFSGFNSTGFTVNIADIFSTSFPIFFLIIKGGAFTVGSSTEPASTGYQEITTNKNIQVVGVFGVDIGTANTVSNGCVWSSGFGDSDGNYSTVFEDTHGTADSIVVSRYHDSYIYQNITANATATSSTSDDTCYLYNSIGPSSFQLYWDNIGQARPFRYCTYGTGIVHNEKTLTLRHAIDAKYNKTLTLRHDVRETKAKTLTLLFDVVPFPIYTKVVRIQKDNSGTNNATQDIDFDFTPKAIIVMSDGNNADNVVSAGFGYYHGFSDGINSACIGEWVADNQDTTLSYKTYRNDAVFAELNETNGTLSSRATCQFLSKKVRLTWVLNDTNNTYLTVYAFGGYNINKVKVATVAAARNTAGTQNYTGLGFNPQNNQSALFTLNTGNTAVGEGGYAMGGFGVAVSTSKRWVFSGISRYNLTTTDTYRIQRDDSCLLSFSSVGTIHYQADFNGWITDGFQLNYINPPSVPEELFSYMVIDGGNWDCGTTLANSSNGNQDITVSVDSRQIRGLLVGTQDMTPLNTITAYNMATFAVTDGTNESLISSIDEDAQNFSDNYRVSDTTGKILRQLQANGADGVVADFTSFGTNQFSINITNAIARYFSWIVVADYIIRGTKTLTLRHDIAEQKSNTLTARYDIRQLMSKTMTLRYDIMQKLSKTLTLLYNIEVSLQHLEKSLTLRHDIREQKNTQVTLRYNIVERIAKTLTLLYGIRQQESKTLTLRHDIAEKINKQLTLLYDIAQKNEKTLTLIYSLNQRIESTLTLRYDLLQKLDKELTLLYDILEKKEVSLTLKYDIVGRLSKTLTLLYNIEVQGMQHFEKQLTLIYNLAEKKNKSFTFRYDLLQKLNKELTLLHNILEQKSKQTTLRYDILEQKNSELTIRHDIREQKSKQITLRYNIFERLVKTLTLKYNILVNLSKTLSLRHDIREQKQNELTLRYDIIGRLSKTLTLLYNIEVQGMQHMEKELSLLYNIMEKKSKQVTLRYNVLQRMQQQLTLRYNILQKLTDQLTMRYDIRQSFDKSLTVRYNVLQQFAKQLTLRYDLIQKMSKQLTLRHDIRQKLDRTLSLRYGIRIRNEKDLTLRYDIIGRLQKTLTLIYNVESLLPHFVKTFTMRYDIREKKSQTLGVKYNILEKLSKRLKLRFRILPKGFVESDHAVMDNKQKDQFNKSDYSWNIANHRSKIRWSRKKGWYVEKP